MYKDNPFRKRKSFPFVFAADMNEKAFMAVANNNTFTARNGVCS
jgi:hypothetical protein